ncbi:MAG: hypothetical protein ABEK50_05965 [bacterium]
MIITLLVCVPAEGITDTSFVEAVNTARPNHRLITDSSVRNLLQRFKPTVYVDPAGYRPMAFYRDYLSHSVLKHDKRGIVEEAPDRNRLRNIKDHEGFYIDYQIPAYKVRGESSKPHTPTYYGRAYRDTTVVAGSPRPLLFLKYTAVFPYSGLPYEMNRLKCYGGSLLGNSYAWHELDIHGSVYVVLDAKRCVPLGIVLAQHNYHRTLWRRHDFRWPETTRINISYASMSNEPYLLSKRKRTRTVRTVGNPRNLAWVYGRGPTPYLDAGYDRVLAPEDGAKSVGMKLRVLPENDPLYTAEIPLGDKRKLFYFWSHWTREGPPGVNYYAPPRIVDLTNLTAFFDVEPSDETFWRLFDSGKSSLMEFPREELLKHQKQKMNRTLETLTSLNSPKPKSCPMF